MIYLKNLITDNTIVKFRDGRLAVALKGIDLEEDCDKYIFYGVSKITPNGVSKHGIVTLDAYDNNLDQKEGGGRSSKYDIMAISNDRFYTKFIIQAMFGFISEEDIYWDWEREEVKEVTMKEVEEQFGCKVKVVKEEN